MTDGIYAASRVLLNNVEANLSKDIESLNGSVYNTLGKSHIDKTQERCWVYKR